MRHLAERHTIDFESQSPKELTQTFHKLNLISQQNCQILTQAINIRDRLMPHREKVPVDLKFALQLLEVVRHLYNQVSESGFPEVS